LKIYMMTDLEGPAGVNRWTQTREGEGPEKTAAMRLLTGEVNAAIEGIHDADPAAEVIVWDGHGTGGLIFEELHVGAQAVMHGRGMGAPHCLDGTFDALFFLGQHAMADTPNAPLCHTYSSRRVQYYKLNGSLIGEIGCVAAMAGVMGIPTVFLSGDDKACAEARALIPDIVTVQTKQGLGSNWRCICRHSAPGRRSVPALPPRSGARRTSAPLR
jgi:D-amino peptidase